MPIRTSGDASSAAAAEALASPLAGPVSAPQAESTARPAVQPAAEPAPAARKRPKAPAAAAVHAAAPKRPRLPQRDGKVAGQPGFVLHSYPYKETSLIIDMFTRQYGRVALIAKGAKRPHSQLRGVLQTFQPLSAGWSGKSELRVLTGAEWVGGMLPLEKTALLCGFYLNELLVKLLARDDPHPVLFDHYVATLNQLAHNEPAAIVLRKFETALLKQTGVAADLTLCTGTRQPVLADTQYVVDPERGPRPERPSDPWPRVAGKTLLDMDREDYSDATTQSQSKQLMRALLAHQLGGAPLNTRQILVDLMQL
jgi:DNA repair protein RecO (recombination protein O)